MPGARTWAGSTSRRPIGGGVWVDPVTGDFDGLRLGRERRLDQVQWHGRNATAYKTNTTWHGELLAATKNDIAAIITTHRTGAASSAGLIIADSSFLEDAGDGIIFGHNNAAFARRRDRSPAWRRRQALGAHLAVGCQRWRGHEPAAT